MNGEVCCILGVCCPPNSAEQRDALAREIKKQVPLVPDDYAKQAAAWMIKNFDLAPKGTLEAYNAAIAKAIKDNKA